MSVLFADWLSDVVMLMIIGLFFFFFLQDLGLSAELRQ